MAQLDWLPIDHRPLATGRYIVAHRGYAEITHFLSPTDHVWMPHTKIGWQKDPSIFRATHCALLPDIDIPATPPTKERQSES